MSIARKSTELGISSFPSRPSTSGFVLQFLGGILLALDVWRVLGAVLLILVTVLASAIFHRWWVPDPLLSHLHLSNLIVNCGVVGGLLLVAAI